VIQMYPEKENLQSYSIDEGRQIDESDEQL
jgi:hypothetical protein